MGEYPSGKYDGVVFAMNETVRPLTPADCQSAAWIKIKEHYTQRLDTLRKQNDANLGAEATAKIRGRIAEAKRILALGDPAPNKVADD